MVALFFISFFFNDLIHELKSEVNTSYNEYSEYAKTVQEVANYVFSFLDSKKGIPFDELVDIVDLRKESEDIKSLVSLLKNPNTLLFDLLPSEIMEDIEPYVSEISSLIDGTLYNFIRYFDSERAFPLLFQLQSFFEYLSGHKDIFTYLEKTLNLEDGYISNQCNAILTLIKNNPTGVKVADIAAFLPFNAQAFITYALRLKNLFYSTKVSTIGEAFKALGIESKHFFQFFTTLDSMMNANISLDLLFNAAQEGTSFAIDLLKSLSTLLPTLCKALLPIQEFNGSFDFPAIKKFLQNTQEYILPFFKTKQFTSALSVLLTQEEIEYMGGIIDDINEYIDIVIKDGVQITDIIADIADVSPDDVKEFYNLYMDILQGKISLFGVFKRLLPEIGQIAQEIINFLNDLSSPTSTIDQLIQKITAIIDDPEITQTINDVYGIFKDIISILSSKISLFNYLDIDLSVVNEIIYDITTNFDTKIGLFLQAFELTSDDIQELVELLTEAVTYFDTPLKDYIFPDDATFQNYANSFRSLFTPFYGLKDTVEEYFPEYLDCFNGFIGNVQKVVENIISLFSSTIDEIFDPIVMKAIFNEMIEKLRNADTVTISDFFRTFPTVTFNIEQTLRNFLQLSKDTTIKQLLEFFAFEESILREESKSIQDLINYINSILEYPVKLQESITSGTLSLNTLLVDAGVTDTTAFFNSLETLSNAGNTAGSITFVEFANQNNINLETANSISEVFNTAINSNTLTFDEVVEIAKDAGIDNSSENPTPSLPTGDSQNQDGNGTSEAPSSNAGVIIGVVIGVVVIVAIIVVVAVLVSKKRKETGTSKEIQLQLEV